MAETPVVDDVPIPAPGLPGIAPGPTLAEPLVIVTVLHWNGGDDTLACIESIHGDGYPNVRILLIDNASTDGIADEVRARWPDVTVLRNPVNLGFTGGQNQAIAMAFERGADFVLIFNQDATFVPGCIAAMVRLAMSDERIGLVSPVIRLRGDPGHGEFWGAWVDYRNARIRQSHDGASAQLAETDGAPLVLWGTALLIRRALVDRIGVLDPRFFAYFEDVDYCCRSSAAGFLNKVCFEASILHREEASWFDRPANYYYYNVRNQLLWWGKTTRGATRIRAARLCIALSLRESGHLRDHGMRPKAEACVDALWDAATGRFGARDARRPAPRWFRKAALAHPYLWANFLEGRLRDSKSPRRPG